MASLDFTIYKRPKRSVSGTLLDIFQYTKLSVNVGVYGMYYAIAKIAPLPPMKFMAGVTILNLGISALLKEKPLYRKGNLGSVDTHEIRI